MKPRTPNQLRWAGTVEIISGALSYTLGTAAAAGMVAIEATQRVAEQTSTVALGHADFHHFQELTPRMLTVSVIAVASGLLLNQSGVRHLGEADQLQQHQ